MNNKNLTIKFKMTWSIINDMKQNIFITSNPIQQTVLVGLDRSTSIFTCRKMWCGVAQLSVWHDFLFCNKLLISDHISRLESVQSQQRSLCEWRVTGVWHSALIRWTRGWWFRHEQRWRCRRAERLFWPLQWVAAQVRGPSFKSLIQPLLHRRPQPRPSGACKLSSVYWPQCAEFTICPTGS